MHRFSTSTKLDSATTILTPPFFRWCVFQVKIVDTFDVEDVVFSATFGHVDLPKKCRPFQKAKVLKNYPRKSNKRIPYQSHHWNAQRETLGPKSPQQNAEVQRLMEKLDDNASLTGQCVFAGSQKFWERFAGKITKWVCFVLDEGGREALVFFACLFSFFFCIIFSNMLAVSLESVIPQEMYVDSVAHRINVWYIYLHLVDFMVMPDNIPYIDPMGGATPETSTGFELTYSNKQKYRNLAKIKGILAAPPKATPPVVRGLIRPYYGKQLVNKPLIRPYFLGGVALGGVS